jgi:energy-coupling factor transport system permease protein
VSSRFLYLTTDSFCHRLHPNTKLLCLLAAFVAVMAFNHPLHEAALLGVAVVLLALTGTAGNLTRSWRFFTTLFVVSALLWTFFIRDVAEPHVLWQLRPVLLDRGSTAYHMMILMLLAGLMTLAVAVLAFVQLVVGAIRKTRGTAVWWCAFGVLVVVGIAMLWRGHGMVPQMWQWYLLEAAYLLALSAVMLSRMRTPAAMALWLGLVFSSLALLLALQGFLAHTMTTGEQFLWGPTVVVTREGLSYGVAMGLRIAAFLSFGLLYISTTTPEEMTQGLRAAGLPLAPSIALSLAFRLVPTFASTAHQVMQAQRARGLDLDAGGIWGRLKRSVPVVVPTLGYALRSADDLTRALETRGLGAGAKRVEYRVLSSGTNDWVALVVMVALAALCVYLRTQMHIGVLLPRL